jgi:hypothetical protein
LPGIKEKKVSIEGYELNDMISVRYNGWIKAGLSQKGRNQITVGKYK